MLELLERGHKLRPLVKQRWLEALRSGKYLHAKGGLRKIRKDDAVGHCCLGVLCDVYRKTRKEKGVRWEGVTYGAFRMGLKGEHAAGYLPRKLREWAGLSDFDQERLAQINDAARTYNYNEVIDYIEANL